jgi:hypothetical protein
MRQPTGWTVPNPDLGDRHFRDKGPYPLHVLKSIDLSELSWRGVGQNNEYRISELAAEQR